MFFILQKEKEEVDNLEIFVFLEILNQQKFLHEYTFMKLEEIKNYKNNEKVKKAIPVGTIGFVQEFLSVFYNIHTMQPIEVPDILRHDKFLKRKYSIVEKCELPKEGYYFIKYVSKLKEFSYTGTIEELFRGSYRPVKELKDGLYQVSEVVDILSEYRCFIQNDDILGIQFYDGDPVVLPNDKDVELLKEMVIRYTVDKTRPKAYTFDVAIIKDRGLALIETHPHTSVGLYGCYGNFLPYSYAYGFDWYVKHNTPLTKYNNFHTFKRN